MPKKTRTGAVSPSEIPAWQALQERILAVINDYAEDNPIVPDALLLTGSGLAYVTFAITRYGDDAYRNVYDNLRSIVQLFQRIIDDEKKVLPKSRRCTEVGQQHGNRVVALRSRVLYCSNLETMHPADNSSSDNPIISEQKKKDRLLTVAELYREIVSSKRKEDDQPSCSAAEALTRQEPFVNQNLAYQSLALITQLLRRGSLAYQDGFCNLTTGQLVPLRL